MGGQGSIGNKRADPQPAFGRFLDRIEAQVLYIDEMSGRLHLDLHQIQQIGAAGDEFGPLRFCNRFGRVCRRFRPFVSKAAHDQAPATSAIASAMLE